MIKQQKYIFKGLNQDIIEDKHPNELYFDANNIRVVTTDPQTQGGVSNEKGNSLVITLPSPVLNTSNYTVTAGSQVIKYDPRTNTEISDGSLPTNSGLQKVISTVLTKEGFVVFSTDNSGFDCIWEVTNLMEGSFTLNLIYCRNLGFNTSNPIHSIFNYENDKIQKIYWVDGKSQLRFLNLKHSISNGDLEELIDLSSNAINIVGNYSLSQPTLSSLSGGGNNTAGTVQYSYNLYRLNGAQTTISPFSEMVPLDNGLILGGGDVNEIVGTSPQMNIATLDTNYTHIKIYAIKYSSFNQTPSIKLILDEEIGNYTNFKFTDTGNSISTLSLTEFLFLGSNPILPNHIESKDNRLFAASYQENAYDLEIDTRAYSHDSNGNTKLYSGNVELVNGQLQGSNISYTGSQAVDNYNYSTDLDAINPDYDTYKYQKNGFILGGEGPFIRYKVLQKTIGQLNKEIKYIRFLKDNEIYRIGIEFYNKLGQKTDAKWIADFKTPVGNLSGNYNTLSVEIKSEEFNNYIASLNLSENEIPVGYKILRAERNSRDMTILCQGSLTGMMFQTTRDASNVTYWNVNSNRDAEAKAQVKIPIPVSRGFSMPAEEDTVAPTSHLTRMNNVPSGNFEELRTEIYTDADPGYKRQQSWQYTRMMNLHSPDILFNTGLVFGGGLQLHINGIANYTTTNKMYKQYFTESQTVWQENREDNIDKLKFDNESSYLNHGFIGPNYDADRDGGVMEFRSYNRKYLSFDSTSQQVFRDIYGIPEIAERGQGATSYNGDSEFNYSNSFESLITDAHKDSDDDIELRGLNSYGSRCGVLVLGASGLNENQRPKLEDLIPGDVGSNNGLLIGEIRRPKSYIYTGNLYGGLSIEEKSRTEYIPIGVYKNITDSTVNIDSAGDIYVQTYKFARMAKTDTEVFSKQNMQLTEIVEHPIETTINLQNRSDISLLNWDNKFQPRYDEFHDYNRVYSQQNNLVKNQSDSFKFKKVNEFGTRIISSKLKVPGEVIDNWTDFLENETIDLDGKYGPIRQLINSNDAIYALQDFGVSFISINPKVQTQGTDGISVELGTGDVLDDYKYLSTTTGTLNKWSVVKSPTGFYYIDIVNKGVYGVRGNQMQKISISAGMDSFFRNNLEYNTLINDNPYLDTGITGIYDDLHKTVMFTVLQGDKSFTISYNEKTQLFESFYDYKPSAYIGRGTQLLSLSPDKNKFYQHFTGEYNNFYGTEYASNITMQVHTQSNDSIFNNIAFKSQCTLNGLDQAKKTITHIRSWNEYQDTGNVELQLNSNLSRKFRMWKANIPREKILNQKGGPGNTMNRIRGQWAKIKLEFQNPQNHNLILHDMNVFYTSYPN